jgi:hypothetical protein
MALKIAELGQHWLITRSDGTLRVPIASVTRNYSVRLPHLPRSARSSVATDHPEQYQVRSHDCMQRTQG